MSERIKSKGGGVDEGKIILLLNSRDLTMAGSSVDNTRTGDAPAAESRQSGSGHRRGVQNQSPPRVDAAVEGFTSTHNDSGDIPGDRAREQQPAPNASAGMDAALETSTAGRISTPNEPAVIHATRATTGSPKESKDTPYELYKCLRKH